MRDSIPRPRAPLDNVPQPATSNRALGRLPGISRGDVGRRRATVVVVVHDLEGVDMSRSWIQDAERMDVAVYAAVAATPTPALDTAMPAPHSRRQLLAALTGRRGGARRQPEGRRAPRGDHGPRVARGHGDRGQPRDQAARTTAPARPRRAGRPARPTRGDARLALVPVRTRRGRIRIRGWRRRRLAGGRRPTARPRRARRLFPGPHGVHYPADVLVGAIIGTTAAQLTTHTLRRFNQ